MFHAHRDSATGDDSLGQVYDTRQMSDPRVHRTIRAIEEASLELLETEGWDALTAARLCRAAGVARSTFYLHYESTWEPVFTALRRRFYERFPEYGTDPPALDPESLLASGRPLSYPVFAHIEEHVELYRLILGSPDGAQVARRLEDSIAEISRAQHAALRELSSETIDADLTAAYLAGAAVASARMWIFSEPRRPASAMAYWFSRMAAPGLLEIMGLRHLLEE